MMTNSYNYIQQFFVFALIGSLCFAQLPTVKVKSFEQTNRKASEYMPSDDIFIERFENALSSYRNFEVISHNESSGGDYKLTIFASGFTDRIELDLLVYKWAYQKGGYIFAVQYSTSNLSSIMDGIDALAKNFALSFDPNLNRDNRTRVFVDEFDCSEKMIKNPIFRMFVSSLLSTDKYIVRDINKKRYDTRDKHHLYQFENANDEAKRYIAKMHNFDAYIDGKIQKVGNEYQISTSMEILNRHLKVGPVLTQLGTRASDIRLSSTNAVNNLLNEYRSKSGTAEIIFDENIITYSENSPKSKEIALRRPDGSIINVKVVLSVTDFRTKAFGKWLWSSVGDNFYFATMKLIVNGVEKGSIRINHPKKSDIDHYERYSESSKYSPAYIKLPYYGIMLEIKEIDVKVYKEQGLFGGVEGSLGSVSTRVVLKRI